MFDKVRNIQFLKWTASITRLLGVVVLILSIFITSISVMAADGDIDTSFVTGSGFNDLYYLNSK